MFYLKARVLNGQLSSSNDWACDGIFLLTWRWFGSFTCWCSVIWHGRLPVNNEARGSHRLSVGETIRCARRFASAFVVTIPLLVGRLRQTWFSEEVEGVGPAVTLLPVPMTVLHFPSQLLKETVGAHFASVLPLIHHGPVWFSLWTSNSYHAVILTTARLRWKNAG